MRRLPLIVLVVVSIVGAQQPNSIGGRLAWNGVDGPPWPIAALVNGQGGAVTLEIGGSTQQPFALVVSRAGLLSSGLATPHGVLDVDLATFEWVADGLSPAGGPLDALAVLDPSGRRVFVAPILPTSSTALGAWQAAVADPASPFGMTLTAATALALSQLPGTAIYVSSSTGSPSNPGSASAPLATITAGVAASVSHGVPHPPVFVAAGTYVESLTIPAGLSLHGGLDSQGWHYAGNATSTVLVGTSPAVIASASGASASITGMTFVASSPSQAGASSIAVRVVGSGSGLTFESCRFHAANAAAGTNGVAGAAGAVGEDGHYELWWSYTSIWNQSALLGQPGNGARPGGAGGDGGRVNGFPYDGQAGQTAPLGGGAGGFGSQMIGGFPPNNGASGPGAGQPGAAGAPGAHGIASSVAGLVVNGAWTAAPPAGDGVIGGLGLGGGGGGGSCTYAGMNGHCGGGGGAGGSPGAGGLGGWNGGASIAVLVVDASPTFRGCDLVAGTGGVGGSGGAGGAGGAGGVGGGSFLGSVVPHGAHGGAGGAGGPGGGGGGGAGGPSWCMFRAGASQPVVSSSVMFSTSQGGAGGSGGARGDGLTVAPSGAAGASGALGP